MNLKRYLTSLVGVYLIAGSLMAQDTLRLTRVESEAIFLKENLNLLAEKLEIPQAEAMVLQASLWPNPNFTLDQVNFWATDKQRGGQEVSPPFFGNVGRNLQVGIEVEQLIQTAGKRKKLMALEQVGVDKAKQYFEDLLRNLKLELRAELTNIQYLQLRKATFINQVSSVKQLTETYNRQVAAGNLPKAEFVRLKALELELLKNISDLDKDINESQKTVKQLLHIPAATFVIIDTADYWQLMNTAELPAVLDLVDQGKQNRPDYHLANLDIDYNNKLYTYEKAQKVPDLVLKGMYDRNGSTMLNFVGFGVAMDLPFFNKNQGNIKAAKIGVEQSKIRLKSATHGLETEIVLAYQNLANALNFQNQIEASYETGLDDLLKSYTKNFTNRNISLLEYLDFLEAYLENKKIIMEAAKDISEKKEELSFAVGKDIFNK